MFLLVLCTTLCKNFVSPASILFLLRFQTNVRNSKNMSHPQIMQFDIMLQSNSMVVILFIGTLLCVGLLPIQHHEKFGIKGIKMSMTLTY
jgi:hypothetical protein